MPGIAQLTLAIPMQAPLPSTTPSAYVMASDPATPGTELARMATAGYGEKILWELARNPSTPPKTLHLLAKYAPSDRQQAVARNPSTSTATLNHLASRVGSQQVLDLVAQHPNTPTSTVAHLVPKIFEHTRQSMALRPGLDVRVMWALFNYRHASSTDIPPLIASRRDAPLALLTQAAHDNSLHVRRAAATNPRLPWAIAVRACVVTTRTSFASGSPTVVRYFDTYYMAMQALKVRSFARSEVVRKLAAAALAQTATATLDPAAAAQAALDVVALWKSSTPMVKQVYWQLEKLDKQAGNVLDLLRAAQDACAPPPPATVTIPVRTGRSRAPVRT